MEKFKEKKTNEPKKRGRPLGKKNKTSIENDKIHTSSVVSKQNIVIKTQSSVNAKGISICCICLSDKK